MARGHHHDVRGRDLAGLEVSNELLGDVLTTHLTDVSICIYVAKIVIILGLLCVCSGKIW